MFCTMLLPCSFFRVKELFKREKWFNYVVNFFFFLKMPKNRVGRSTLNGDKKRRRPNQADRESVKKVFLLIICFFFVSSINKVKRNVKYCGLTGQFT